MAIGIKEWAGQFFLRVQPTDWSRPSPWLAAWGKSDSLARLSANPHTETRESPRVWGLVWRSKLFPSLHDFVYHAKWKKVRVAERLSPWTQDSSCPLCRSVETLHHALGDYLFHRGRLKRSARAVQLFGRLAVLETHTLRY